MMKKEEQNKIDTDNVQNIRMKIKIICMFKIEKKKLHLCIKMLNLTFISLPI